MTSYNDTPSLAMTDFPSMLNSIVAASTSGLVAGFKPIVASLLARDPVLRFTG
jgi:hypothetical protein